jgi:hypothetical protein
VVGSKNGVTGTRIDSAARASYVAPTHHAINTQTAGSHVRMERCASCEQAFAVRLFDIRIDGQLHRYWWCPACAFAQQRGGMNVEPSPAWIERAALKRLPVKELVRDPERVSSRPVAERRRSRFDRRRWSIHPRPPERRRSASYGRRVLDAPTAAEDRTG